MLPGLLSALDPSPTLPSASTYIASPSPLRLPPSPSIKAADSTTLNSATNPRPSLHPLIVYRGHRVTQSAWAHHRDIRQMYSAHIFHFGLKFLPCGGIEQ